LSRKTILPTSTTITCSQGMVLSLLEPLFVTWFWG